MGPHVPDSGNRHLIRHIPHLLEDAKCCDPVRQRRGSAGVVGPPCGAAHGTQPGRDATPPARPRYQCQACQTQVDDRPGTIVAGHHQPWRVGMLCLYGRGRHRSKAPLAQALEGPPHEVQRLAAQLRDGRGQHPPDVTRTGEVACDEVAGVAGQTGPPEAVNKTAGPPAAAG